MLLKRSALQTKCSFRCSLCRQCSSQLNCLSSIALANAVDGADQIVALVGLLLVVGKQRQLGRGEDQPVADQAYMPDADAPGPGQPQGAPGQFEKGEIVGRGRFGGQLTGATQAVRVVQETATRRAARRRRRS